jgi:hypothetical protein
MQIAGKTVMALTPLENHWWNVTFLVTPRGLGSRPVPFAGGTFSLDFDLVAHRLWVRTSQGEERGIALVARSVADFYAEYTACLQSLGIEAAIRRRPVEFDDPTPFDEDRHHASYDRSHVENFRRILLQTDRIFKEFRSRFIGKSSPVHFFWGSFDLAVTRFSGRRAAPRPDADSMTREAYSHEVISCGFWPGDRRYRQAAFYSYTAPSPAGLEQEPVRPGGWNSGLGEFILNYDEVRSSGSPEQAVLDFCQSTYEAGARLARWDRGALERQPAGAPNQS